MNRPALALAIVAVLGGAGVLYAVAGKGAWGARKTSSTTSSGTNDVATLAHRVDSLERAVRLLTAQLAAPQPAQDWGPTPSVFPAPAGKFNLPRPASVPPGQAMSAEPEIPVDPLEGPVGFDIPNPAEVAGHLLDQYNAQPDDPQADKTTAAALRAIGARATVMRLTGQPTRSTVDCRSQVCRYTATFPNSGSAEIWRTVLLANMGSEFPRAESIVVPNDDRTATLWVYASRP